MLIWIKSYASRQRYRYASALLITIVLATQIVLALLGAPEWLEFVFSLPFALILIVLSHYRMVDAAMSPGWVLLMILMFNFGPSVELPGITLFLSNLIHLVPVAIGWIVPTSCDAGAVGSSGVKRHEPAT